MICRIAPLLVVAWLAAGTNAYAQTAVPPAQPAPTAAPTNETNQIPERVEIGLSKERVEIRSDFSGEQLTLFGAVDNVDPLIQRQGRYDIFVVLEGPVAPLTTRKKGRVFGVWMNVEGQRFENVPASYLVASTRQSRDITSLDILARLSLGIDQIRLGAAHEGEAPDAEKVLEFTRALRDVKRESALYREFPGNVEFISQSLFRAELQLPANVPLGLHRARAYLFRSGVFVAQTQANLQIVKAGLEIRVFNFAHNQPLFYGMACVLMALLIGWLGRIIFKKD